MTVDVVDTTAPALVSAAGIAEPAVARRSKPQRALRPLLVLSRCRDPLLRLGQRRVRRAPLAHATVGRYQIDDGGRRRDGRGRRDRRAVAPVPGAGVLRAYRRGGPARPGHGRERSRRRSRRSSARRRLVGRLLPPGDCLAVRAPERRARDVRLLGAVVPGTGPVLETGRDHRHQRRRTRASPPAHDGARARLPGRRRHR